MEDQADQSGAKWLVTVHFSSGCPPYSSAVSSASFAFNERCAKVLRGARYDQDEVQLCKTCEVLYGLPPHQDIRDESSRGGGMLCSCR